MTARVLFFGATADIARTREIEIEVSEGFTSGSILQEILEKFPRLTSHKLHLSINQQYALGDEIVHDEDELAVFTAVSGG